MSVFRRYRVILFISLVLNMLIVVKIVSNRNVSDTLFTSRKYSENILHTNPNSEKVYSLRTSNDFENRSYKSTGSVTGYMEGRTLLHYKSSSDYKITNSETDRSVQHFNEAVRRTDYTDTLFQGYDYKRPYAPNPMTVVPPIYLPNYRNPCWKDANSTIKCLPYWFMAGFQKCGTTDMYSAIHNHRLMDMPRTKEPYYWTRGRLGKRCFVGDTFEKYLKNFYWSAQRIENSKEIDNKTGEIWHPKITGDSSLGNGWDNYDWMYEKSNHGEKEVKYLVADYIHHFIPQARIIMAVRNPVDRMVSSYRFYAEIYNATVEDFHKKVVRATNYIKKCYLDGGSRRSCIYDPPYGPLPDNYMNAEYHWHPVVRIRIGMYIEFIKDWLKLFPRERLHIISFERYREDRVAVTKAVHEFLGLPPMNTKEESELRKQKIWNQTKGPQLQILNKTIELLQEFYQPFNDQLAELLQDEHFRYNSS